MKKEQKDNFVRTSYDLLASTKLSSTQKLFISYIIGWQKNNLICFETNNTLASKFGMKYGGIRSLLKTLNEYEFFKSVKIDFDKKSNTSGHEITVNVEKLEEFLNSEDSKEINTLMSEKNIENQEIVENSNAKTTQTENIIKYNSEEIIQLSTIMSYLNFDELQIANFKKYFKTEEVTFEKFAEYFFGLVLGQKRQDIGITISDEQQAKLSDMFANQ